MNSKDLVRIRHFLGKTQVQLAGLLSVSPKAVQSFEQGWRHIPFSAERQLLIILSLKKGIETSNKSCWEVKGCPGEWRENCIVWEYRARYFCWLLNGTYCQGALQQSLDDKMKLCRQCEVFQSAFPFILD